LAGPPIARSPGGHPSPIEHCSTATPCCGGSGSVLATPFEGARPARVHAVTPRSVHREARRRRAVLWLGAAWLLMRAALAGAQSESEIASAGRQLRELGAAIEPLPDSPVTRDVGQIAIVAHDGSSYDRILEGQPNYLARERVGRRFYEAHADEYDFLVVFTNFEFDTGGATAFHLHGRNDVLGIGKPVGSVAPVVFGSPARLKGWIDMAAVSRYRQRPLSLAPGDPGFLRTLSVLAHEMGHQWLAEARYKTGDSVFDDLLGQDEAHWSYLLDSDASFLYGAKWRDNGDGSFTAAEVGERFSALDLYLMGLLPKEKVAPLRLLRNPAIDRHRVNREGDVVAANDTTEILIQQLIDAMGPRRPDSLHSQKEFRLGFVFLAGPGTEPTAEDLEAVERVRSAFGAHLFALTRGIAWADTTLGGTPPAPRAATPDVDRALAWLGAQQQLDGSWSDAVQTQVRDTAAAVGALLRAGATGPAWQRGLSWLRQTQPESLDFRARAGAALSEAGLPAATRAMLAAALLQTQNADGGFGAGRDFASDALDTALALRALAAWQHPADDRALRAVAALLALANPDGGFAAVPGGETSTVVTAEVLLALLDWKDVAGSATLRGTGLAALLARRNPDGGFGASPSTPHASALALDVLLAAGAGAELVDPLVAWLERDQLADGSWSASPYQTALVVSALRRSLGANLVVPADMLVVAPNPAREGDTVRVTARVRNTGRASAAASVARLHDGDPASSPALGESPVPALAASEEAEVAFDYATSDRPGSRTLYVVADAARQVRESREDDNATSRTLTVEGLLADLRLGPEDIALAPAGPEIGEPASITVTVRNTGARAASPSALLVLVTDPVGTSIELPLVTLPALAPGEAASVPIPWSPERAGRHVLRATADARYDVPESDETNGVAVRIVQSVTSAPAGPQLAVMQASVTPASLEELPQPIEVRAIVENLGRSAAATTVAVVDQRTGELLGVVPVDREARSTGLVLVRGTVSIPGSRQLAVVVDPDGSIAEADEVDNTFAIGFPDAQTHDLELSSVSLSAADVEHGDPVTVSAEVRNRGTLDVLSIPIQLAHGTTAGPVELARATLSLAAGEAKTVVLSWPASIIGEAVPLLARVDPFDLLVERREDNNAVALTLRVRPSGRPNLAVSGADVTIDPDPPVEGQSATLSAIVRNTGVVPAGTFTVRFVVGDPEGAGTVIGEAPVDGLAAGEARTLSLAWPRVDVRGSLGLHVLADPDGRVEESSERDNRGFRPFSAIGLPDLVLTAAEVTLDPGYPRAGESVTIQATVRNLGGRPSSATTLAVAEGELRERIHLASLPVAALEPGTSQTLSLAWAPAEPPGARPLSLVLDPDELVTEQDEGNNAVLENVVVQDADLFLTEPFFSPDGDGVKDQTTLAWRATGRVRVVVSNSRGEPVRTLVEDGPPSGSATWDGRDERGLVAWDGPYTFSIVSQAGQALGRAVAVLDTNRSPIHDAIPGRTTFRNVTCGLPDYLFGPVWMPGEDELIYIFVPDARPGFPVGLLRVGVNGGHTYVAQDDWYRFASYAGDAPVSPDGREVLVSHSQSAQTFRVDLLTGERRPLGAPGYHRFTWSPDGRFILRGGGHTAAVFARDGSPVGDLGSDYGAWAWSPASDRLASVVADGSGDPGAGLAQVVIVARDGTSLGAVSLPRAPGDRADSVSLEGFVWRGDGKIVATVRSCVDTGGEVPDCGEGLSFLVDPDAATATRLPFSASGGAWSPDGSRILLSDGELRLENGTSLGPLLASGSSVSPRSSAATFRKGSGDTNRPGSVCGGKPFDTFFVSSAANLASQLDVARLPGNSGLIVRGTAADRNLERFQLDYASQADPSIWHPIGAALDAPVLDDVFTVWVPPGPGTYLLRLSVSDLAGHASVRTRVVSWDRAPLLANFTQSDYYLSPDDNGVKDAVLFRYTVLAPARVDVRVVGPEPVGADDPAAREVFRAAFEHATVGPQSFTWRGRDDSLQVVADGRYTVYLNDLPFRVEVDNTPPEIGLRFEKLHVAGAPVSVWPKCSLGGLWRPPALPGPFSSVAAERAWHVVDERLKSWVLRTPGTVPYVETQPVFVPDADASGAPVLAGGRPRVRRENGRPVDRRDPEHVLRYGRQNNLRLEAWDYAGNHSSIQVEPPPEAIFPLGALWQGACQSLASALAVEASDAEGQPLGRPVNGLRAEKVVLQAGTTQRLPPGDQDLRLVFSDVDGGPERELALLQDDLDGHRNLVVESFAEVGVDPTRTYRGRFGGRGEAGPIASDSFVFSPCSQYLQAVVSNRFGDPKVYIVLRLRLDAAVVEARASLEIERIDGSRTPVGTLDFVPIDARTAEREFLRRLGPDDELWVAALPDLPTDCANRLRVKVRVRDVAGNLYPSKDLESACQALELVMPATCGFAVSLRQEFKGCSGSPDQVYARAAGVAEQPARVTFESGPADNPTLIEAFDFVPTPENKGTFTRDYERSLAGHDGDTYPLRGRVVPLDPRFGPGEKAALFAIVDRSPPVGEILLPPEGGSVCLAPGSLAPPLETMARIDDAAPLVDTRASWRRDGGAWAPLQRLCDDDACRKDPTSVPVGRPFPLAWNAAQLDTGGYEIQLQLCDRSGNQGTTTRRFLVTRDPPALQVVRLQHPVFSPNGDGRAEETQLTLRLAQAGSLSARVHAANAQGPIVRTLFTDVPATATDVLVAWDGRRDDRQTVPDGEYEVVLSVADACGGASRTSTKVEVDTVPPEVAISEPTGGQRVSASVDVLGRATDAHFAVWELDLACGASPECTRLGTKTIQVAPGSFLARWDTSRAPPGECRLRLVAEDRAENRSAEVFATATVERGELLDGLSATPEVFSPNGDGRRETATLSYTLVRAARVRLEVRAGQGRVLRTFDSGGERAAGTWSHVWDGLQNEGSAAPDGLHVMWVRAEDPSVATVYEEKAIRLDLDRMPPQVAVTRPAPDAIVSPSASVRGSVTDRNLAEFALAATPVGGAAVELFQGLQSLTDADLAPLAALTDGPHVLRIAARDAAENETGLDVPFLVDATPPRSAIQSPADGAILRRGETPIEISGLVGDLHLNAWTLRFGAGTEPGSFVAIGQGNTGGNGIPLGRWDVRFVPDGVYTLSLLATDRAGLSSESRIAVTLDSHAPTVALLSPAAGGYVTAPGAVIGTASDVNLGSWSLDVSPGAVEAAYQWSPLGSGRASVPEATLADWAPLPPDGVYALRLAARDKVDLGASTRVTVTVDTTPPARPTGLVANVKRAREGYGRVVVTWNPNSEPDLAGYRIQRAQEPLHAELLGSPAWNDGERLEGRYSYSVVAADKAGNESAPATLKVLVDLTPPIVSFSLPAEGARVVGAIDVRGTAHSADDFAEYRLFVGVGDAPAAWTLLRRSSVPVAAGVLGEWLALVDGPHVLAVEADDTNGNRARAMRRVIVDTLPPEPPVLVDVAKQPPPADWLVLSWQPSPSSDEAGTLVYRNGRLANSAGGVALGDRSSFLVPGASYEDRGLPDGEHCYRVVAMDRAGNESVPSNEICQSLDNRAPRALITHPPDGTRFGFPLHVVAEAPDLDVVSVRFERRVPGAGDWVGFGEVRSTSPWETTLDPRPAGQAELPAGPHELRAVATDRAGNTDPAPSLITVIYGDTTPPAAPTGLIARVLAADVALSWTPVAAPDLASYRVYRDGERIATDLAQPSYADSGLAVDTFRYTVTAVDRDGNESQPSQPADAVVYMLRLDAPAWPVVSAPVGAVTGGGSRPQTTLKVLRAGDTVAEGPGTGGAFRIDGVPLAADGNRLRAQGEDAEGNRSVPSHEIVLISNAPPAAVAGLGAEVDAEAVSLRWTPVPDADLFGYVVRRDDELLTTTSTQEEAAEIVASSREWQAAWAFDRNPATAWTPEWPGTATWTVSFPSPVLVERLRLRFGSPDAINPGIPTAYTILARWQDRDLPIVRARGNTRLAVEHDLPSPFLTTALSVVFESLGALAEVSVERLEAVPMGAEAFLDEGVPDGRHTYSVTAIDRYGAEGAPGTVEAAVGDVDPPGPPTGVVATPVVRDVHLTWSANPEPDVTGYVVLRDGARIGTSPSPAYVDPGRPNGTYSYTVIAKDTAGHESGESGPADATIDGRPVPPSAPEILEPTDAAHPISLAVSRTDVAGRAPAGTSVALEVDGELRGTAPAAPGFRAETRLILEIGEGVALSADGRWAAWSEGAELVALRDLESGSVRLLAHGGSAGAVRLVFSPDASVLALTRWSSGSGSADEVVLLRLGDGSTRALTAGSPVDYVWSPDGTSLVVSLQESEGGSLHRIDVETGSRVELARGSGVDSHLRWSPDVARLAFIRSWSATAAELRVLELDGSREQVLDAQPWPAAPPSWSPDGRRVAWTSAETRPLRVRVQELAGSEPPSEVSEAGSEIVDARFSPDGDWLSVVRLLRPSDGTTLRSVAAIHQRLGLRVTVSEPRPAEAPPDAHEWLGGRLALRVGAELDRYAPEAGRFLIRDVPLVPGENRLVARATDVETGQGSSDSAAVLVTVAEQAFPDVGVVSEGIVSLPPLPLAGLLAELRVHAFNRGDADAGETEIRVRVVAPGGAIALDALATIPAVASGRETSLLVSWTPASPGSYRVLVEVDPNGRVFETSEANNTAERTLVVAAEAGLAAEVVSDRASYPPMSTALVTVQVANSGPPFEGMARTTVEELDDREVAVIDEREVSLEWGKSLSFATNWTTGTTRAGRYAFRVRVRATSETAPAATAERGFDIEPGLTLLARVRPQPVTVDEGAPARFALSVDNRSANAPLEGATARLRLQLEGTSGPATFETIRPLAALLPGGTWEALDVWPSARPTGRYAVRFEVEKGGAVLAGASAVLTITAAVPVVAGTLAVAPGDVLAGQSAEAHLTLENRGRAGVMGYPIAVDVVAGPDATVHGSVPASIDLAAGESRLLTMTIATGTIAPGPYVVRLRGGTSPVTLDRASLVVHGLIAPPSPHAPANGTRVPTAHPSLVVNNAASPEGALLRYEFELFGDEALTQTLPGARGVPETASRTAWPVAAGLAEDTPYWWRARASDGFSTSGWSQVASFTVDAVNQPPTSPVPDTPAPGARVASRQPGLTVRNAVDPERQPLTYEFRLATDESMTGIVAAEAGIVEGLGLTTWTVTATLDEDALYYWSARARTLGDAPEDFSPWSVPVAFRVDTFNGSPSAPRPLRPVGGQEAATNAPELVIENATDPEGDALSYRFEIDTRPELNSPAHQVSPALPAGAGETAWAPPLPLAENTFYHWRAHASDGNTVTPSVLASFFVDTANEAPGAPVPLDPVDGRSVGSATPTLRLRNAVDPEQDPLAYDFEVRSADGAVVAAASGIPAGRDETTWTVEPPLPEDQRFTWSARASDGELFGPWSAPAAFRVNAVIEPPTAPVPFLPADGSVVGERRLSLVVENATSPDDLSLTYTFELEAVAADGFVTPVDRAEGLAEGPQTTSWTPSVDLADGSYQWRARVSDPHQNGPWSSTSRFSVLVDPPPAAPTGLRAAAGDARVRLEWNAHPEPDVTGYRVHRAFTSGGPYAFVAAVTATLHLDTGVTNGVTYYYVVTATDARAESAPSNEAAARPEAKQALVAEVRYDPSVIRGECLLPRDDHDDDRDDRGDGEDHGDADDEDDGDDDEDDGDDDDDDDEDCPKWLLATLELPVGHDPATIDLASLRLLGSVTAEPGDFAIVDSDHDGLPELRVRFRFEAVAPHLSVGANTATIVGHAAGTEFLGAARIDVLPLAAELRITPRTLQRRSCGEDVQARITFAEDVRGSQVAISSVRLNGVVGVDRVVEEDGRVLVVKFERAAVSGVLQPGASVEVRVTGMLAGLPFVAVDHIRVIE